MNNGSFSIQSTLEVLTTRKSGREVHRHWSDGVKAQIVSESFRPGAMVNEVAERHGLKAEPPVHLANNGAAGHLVPACTRERGGVRDGDS
ncbi:transposase [Rhizobium ruizarguesonis]